MPTKDELMDENAALKAKIAELEEQAASAGDPVEYENGLYVYNDGMGFALAGVTHGVYTYDGDEAKVMVDQADMDALMKGDDRVAMLEADVQQLRIERDDARNKVAKLEDKLLNAGTLHCHVDSLKAPY